MFDLSFKKSHAVFLKKRQRMGVWLPNAIEPVCKFFSLKSLQSLRLEEENDRGWVIHLVSDEKCEDLACFEKREEAAEALQKLSHKILNKSYFGSTSIKVLTLLSLSLVTLSYLISPHSASLQTENNPSPPGKERVEAIEERVYGVPIDAESFLKRSRD